jgi:hypothetical protein
VPVLAFSKTFLPEQIVVGPVAVIVASGIGFTVTAKAADVAEHPATFVTITV